MLRRKETPMPSESAPNSFYKLQQGHSRATLLHGITRCWGTSVGSPSNASTETCAAPAVGQLHAPLPHSHTLTNLGRATAECRPTDNVAFHDLPAANHVQRRLYFQHVAWNSTAVDEPILNGCPRQV